MQRAYELDVEHEWVYEIHPWETLEESKFSPKYKRTKISQKCYLNIYYLEIIDFICGNFAILLKIVIFKVNKLPFLGLPTAIKKSAWWAFFASEQ